MTKIPVTLRKRVIDRAKNRLTMNRQVVLSILKEHLEEINQFGVKSLALFGSTARNEATSHSDLDFLVEFEGVATLDGYMGLKFFLEDLFNKDVDLVTRRSLKPQITEKVLQEAIYVKEYPTVSQRYS